MTEFEVFATIISGAAHDLDHPGTNNQYEIKRKSKLATLYNDQSVLENYHAASFFSMVTHKKHECNFLDDLPKENQMLGRKMIIDNILGTDMTKH